MKSRELPLRVFLSGDVMTGRGIDQILPHACDPRIYEPVMSSAEGYVRLAEKANGAIARPVNFEYIWGAALEELKDGGADAYIVNLETSITRCCDFLPKGINYRMSPENAGCLLAASVYCCVLANNHVLDWGHHGLVETLATLEKLGIRIAGAGRNLFQARMSAVLKVRTNRRVVVFALASLTSGTPKDWAAEESAAGVNLLLDLSDENAIEINRDCPSSGANKTSG
jgi:poly-gamma-glutamate capsule biosynthesis protein CapA/YwtB (metallophosphatase superfamily)